MEMIPRVEKRKKHTNTSKQKKLFRSTMNSSWKSSNSLLFSAFLNAATVSKVTRMIFWLFESEKRTINLLFHWFKVEEHTIFFLRFLTIEAFSTWLWLLSKRNKHFTVFLLLISCYQRKKLLDQALKLGNKDDLGAVWFKAFTNAKKIWTRQ